jgi:hypothetical protein
MIHFKKGVVNLIFKSNYGHNENWYLSIYDQIKHIVYFFSLCISVNNLKMAYIKLKHIALIVVFIINSCVWFLIIDNFAYTQLTKEVTCFISNRDKPEFLWTTYYKTHIKFLI